MGTNTDANVTNIAKNPQGDGGPAFPCDVDLHQGFRGATLRDYFAAKAMQGEFSSLADPDIHGMGDAGKVAERAYIMANAMLAARALPSPAAQAAPEPSLGEGSKDELIAALRGILKRYVDFVLSGDGGNWDPEEEAAVIGARAALAKVEGK
jgi:hypothetical protein